MTAAEAFALALSLLEHRDLPQAIRSADGAEAMGYSEDACAGIRWHAHMLSGDFARAWEESDSVRRRGAPDPNRFWNGEDVDGKRVIVRCLHGFGDAVQFLRYIPLLRRRAASVLVEVPSAMVELARCLNGIPDVVSWKDAPQEFDIQMEVMELPYFFRSTLNNLPRSQRYLSLPRPALDLARNALGDAEAFRVGIVWSCGEWNPARAIPFDLLWPLLATRGCEFWNLQGGEPRDEWQTVSSPAHRDAPMVCDAGLLPLAAAVEQMDLVITVDTVTAHVGGALGVPVWVLLQHSADWRWMLERKDSPWYPSLRLFRQPEPGNWQAVVEELQSALESRLRTRTASRAA